MLRTLLLGARSQLGHDILQTWPADSITPLAHDACDVADPAAVAEAMAAYRPELVVNLAASHRVDDVEREPGEALRVNAHGAWIVAAAATQAGAAIAWVSTDYVFDGGSARPYTESDPVGPVNAYGVSKAAGERLVALANPRHFVVRSSGLYGVAGASGKGGNFVQTMLRLAGAGQPIRVVHDQVLGPTFTLDLAVALAQLVQTEAYGTYHATNAGAISWHDFAALVFRVAGIRADLAPTTSAAYGAPAARPAYSVLANHGLRGLGITPLPPVEDALGRYLHAKGLRPAGA